MPAVADLAELAGLYRDLHAHPELAFAEHRTAAIIAARLRDLGYRTTAGVGGTGVVGVLASGAGPTVLLRADMDALPVREQTGLDYACDVPGTAADGRDVPVMHACGHDMHVTCLLGAAAELAAGASAGTWHGTLMLVFQPAGETGEGARAMLDDGCTTGSACPTSCLASTLSPCPPATPPWSRSARCTMSPAARTTAGSPSRAGRTSNGACGLMAGAPLLTGR